MRKISENIIQEIGQMAFEEVDQDYKKFLLYAIYEEGTISNGLFFNTIKNNDILFVEPSDNLTMKCFSLWKEMSKKKQEWVLMVYNVNNEKFNLDFKYKESFPDGIDEPSLRKEILIKFFGTNKVKYPQ